MTSSSEPESPNPKELALAHMNALAASDSGELGTYPHSADPRIESEVRDGLVVTVAKSGDQIIQQIETKWRSNYAAHHMHGALLHAVECANIEARESGRVSGAYVFNEEKRGHIALSTSAVIAAVCAMEATANEFLLDLDVGTKSAVGMAMGARDLILENWDTVDRQDVLRKFDWILSMSRAERMDRGGGDYQSAQALISLRNSLVHFRPSWSNEPKHHAKLEAQLKGKFALNPLSLRNQTFLPFRCLGSPCARWAVRTARDFVCSFYRHLGVDGPFVRAAELWDRGIVGTE